MDQDHNTLVEDHRRKVEKLKYLTTYRNDNKQVNHFGIMYFDSLLIGFAFKYFILFKDYARSLDE